MLVLAAWSCGQETAAPGLTAGEALRDAPASGLLDEGNVFNAEESVLVAAELEDFRHRVGLPAFVVTANYISGNTVDVYAERLVTAWSKGRPAVVLLYERGSGKLNYSATPGALGRMEDMKALFLSASRASGQMPGDATAAQRLRAALHGLTLSAETWRKTGTLPASGSAPPPAAPTPPVPPTAETRPAAPVDLVMDDAEDFGITTEAALRTEPVRGSASGTFQIITGLAATLVLGSALLFLFHRLQERLERRSSEQFHFPDVTVGCRLGAPQGGGQVAGISFRNKPRP